MFSRASTGKFGADSAAGVESGDGESELGVTRDLHQAKLAEKSGWNADSGTFVAALHHGSKENGVAPTLRRPDQARLQLERCGQRKEELHDSARGHAAAADRLSEKSAG